MNRRDFFKISAAGGGASLLFGFDVQPALAQARSLKIAGTTETHSICPYCAVGCGIVIHTLGDKAKNVTPQVVDVEGDPDDPINRGALCPKGASLFHEILNERRLLKPQVRRPGATEWEDISWDQAINEIARHVKRTRDETFIETDDQGRRVNRCESIAFNGGCTDTNEMNYLIVKTMRSLGICYLENQARISHGSTVSSLGSTFGRGAMTNGWIDIKNADMILVMGGNPAENHPCGFMWAMEAKRKRNAKLLVVDPRLTRTASVSDMFLQIRPGTDIAFLGGLINYALQKNYVARDYLVNYTNASFIIKADFKLPEDGLYSGYDPQGMKYDVSTWNYEEGGDLTPKDATAAIAVATSTLAKPAAASSAKAAPAAAAAHAAVHSSPGKTGQSAAAQPTAAPPPAPAVLPPKIAYDLTLEHPRCVFQLLKQQYARYTPEIVESITGIPQDKLLSAYEMFSSIRRDGNMKKAGTIIYSSGWTQHSSGAQIIRAAAVMQMLLGNIGRAGGGMNGMGGYANVQGATDMGGMFDVLPGYLKVPIPADKDFDAYITRVTPRASKPEEWDSQNYWTNTPRFAVSFLKSIYGDAATKENGWAFNYLPRIDRRYSWVEQWDAMYKGKIKGLLAFGMNGVAIGPNSQKNIDGLKKADWLVVCETYPDETSEFWRSPGVGEEEMKNIKTEVYRLPGAGFAEKDGTLVNSARWLKWKYAAVPTPGDARLDQEILARIFLKLRDLYKGESGKFPDPILNASWAYTTPWNPSFTEIAKEINGKALADLKDPVTGQEIKAGQQLPGFAWLRDDGTTSSANWLYCGSWTETGPESQRRGTEDPSGLGIYPNYAWSWPANRRVMYNRASCDINGKPWDAERKQVWWSDSAQRWLGNDVPDFKADSHPRDHMGPFTMNPEGVGRVFAPLAAMAEGPFPEHYEPFESPIANQLHAGQSGNPVVRKFSTADDRYARVGDDYDVICTTCHLTEHYEFRTRNNPVNVELAPEPFVEISEEMAQERGINGGDRLKISSIRGSYYAKAMVTKRIKPLTIGGQHGTAKKTVHPIGVPVHWGYQGIWKDKNKDKEREGSAIFRSANILSPTVIDPNAYTPEFKGFMVKVEKA